MITLAGKLLQFAAYESRSGPLVYDFSGESLTACPFSFNKHGEMSLDISIDLSYEAAQVYLQPRPMLIYRVNDGMRILWEGRGQIPKWADGQLQINALGLWLSLDDIRYTAFWSTQKLDGWEQPGILEIADAYPERFTFEQDSTRLYITAENGTQQGVGRIAYFGYRVPSRSRRNITNIDYNYTWDNAVSWQYGIQARTDAWGFTGIIGTAPVGDGAPIPESGTSTLTHAGTPAVVLFYRFTGADTPYSGLTGSQYIQLSNVRLRSFNGVISTQEIARDIHAAVRSVNPGMLDARTDKISGTATYDHREAIFEDALATEILPDLCAKAATGSPPVPLQVGVWAGVLTIADKGSGSRTWYHDLLDIQAERDASTITNAAYATYQDANGRTLRTAETSDQRSIDRLGVVKVEYVQADTTDATQAANQATMLLNDRKLGAIPFTIPATTVVYDANGAPVPVTEIRPGDKLVPQQFRVYDLTDALYLITIGTVTIDAIAGTVQMEAEEPIPTLEIALAQQAE